MITPEDVHLDSSRLVNPAELIQDDIYTVYDLVLSKFFPEIYEDKIVVEEARVLYNEAL